MLRLSADGLTPISDVGMKSYFRKKLRLCDEMLGTFDKINGEYNLTITPKGGNPSTVSFNEAGKGWVSFKSFIPDVGGSVSGMYFTSSGRKIYKHYTNIIRNSFYGSVAESSIEVVFNDAPESVKSFIAMNYEGTQSRVTQFDTSSTMWPASQGDGGIIDAAGNLIANPTDGEYFNLNNRQGWYLDSFATNLQDSDVVEFKNKEGKWFSKLKGRRSQGNNIDSKEFSVQGLGVAQSAATGTSGSNDNSFVTLTVQNDPTT